MSQTKDPLYRQLALLQLIPRWPQRISTPTLLEKLRDRGFEVDIRSLQRDLRDKLARHFPIVPYTDKRPYRWGYREDAWFDPRRVRSLPNGKALLPAELPPQLWTLVSTALVENRQLRVEYRSRSQGTSKSYRIHPAGLVTRHSISYLIGTANDYSELRQFVLHRIQHAELLDEPAREHADFDIDRYIDSGAFAWRQDAAEVELIADVHPQIAWLLDETPLTREQTLVPLEGSDWQRLHARVPLDQETLWWIFALNDQIRVHAPQVWVEEIGRRLASLQRLYTASDASCRNAVEDGDASNGYHHPQQENTTC